ncbi:hypothetical protein V8G54_030775 [Vigna mungo]|uniref:Uncharacterized protein n=1 Tax=Vigna mungo TaxID=3915 RepID=A0AAQ3MXN3_VIGMU
MDAATPPGVVFMSNLFLSSAPITPSASSRVTALSPGSFSLASVKTSDKVVFSDRGKVRVLRVAADWARAPNPPLSVSFFPVALISATCIAAASLSSTGLSPAPATAVASSASPMVMASRSCAEAGVFIGISGSTNCPTTCLPTDSVMTRWPSTLPSETLTPCSFATAESSP